MSRTVIPPVRNTTGTTTVAYGGVSPIDCSQEDIDRPMIFVETTCLDAVSTATASIPAVYVKATLTAGMSGNISATAAHFITHCGGAAVGKISGVGSYINIDTGFTAYAGGLDVAGVITPLNVAIRSQAGATHTLTSGMMVYGMHAQYLQSGTGDPVYDTDHTNIYFARLNSTLRATAIFYAENTFAVNWVAAGTHTTERGQLALAWVHSGYDHPCFVKLYSD